MVQVIGNDGAPSGLGSGAGPFGVWGDAGLAREILGGGPAEPGTGVVGTCSAGTGVAGHADAGTGVSAVSATGAGIAASSGSGAAVTAVSTSGTAIEATSQQGSALVANSSVADAISSTSASPQHAGVSANNSANGIGPYASSVSGTAIFATSPSGPAVSASSQQGSVIVANSSVADAINSTSDSPAHAGVSANNSTSGIGLYASRQGGLAGSFVGDVHATGTIHAGSNVTCNGADFAEDFDVAVMESAEPGTVMVLESDGVLKPSSGAYDKRVAGVVSGAGSYKPGLILNRTSADGKRVPVALLGKVFCKVDASYGPVEVGDLLTTSPTPGHAMAVRDASRAFGTVVGKALQSLAEGRGLVPILVALH